jgi:hypothetical protein
MLNRRVISNTTLLYQKRMSTPESGSFTSLLIRKQCMLDLHGTLGGGGIFLEKNQEL